MLAANFENLTLVGANAVNGTGTADANVLVGNDASKRWIRTNGLAPAAKLASIIREIAAPQPGNTSPDGRTSK